ncbi:histidine phosphatase family protein [Sulfitobacter sp. OXR-159]|uniref:SixA phosphatase family protein n=1 Tax=Sulfitobacter sp. OXR-159 TaxID=3100174 RepID=UPI002AC96E70|nr:histidine phosphatase family protein [Sulfitobacter sp. OXR-159]WPZ29992.1 histidine phosphatase family protein [Sulfitobacter sp. OXR-159]
MRRLILMRHAKSDWSHGTSDHDRPLNPRGRGAAEALGNWLRAEGFVPDVGLCSTAARTRETCALLNLPESCAVEHLRQLYLAEPNEIIANLRQRASGDTLLLVAHNPGIAAAAALLLQQTPDQDAFDRYPSGATTVMDFDIDSWADLAPGSAALHAFTVPKQLV